MRILCTFVGGHGHLAPLLPLARAARAAGHEVLIAGSGGLVPAIEAAGLGADEPHNALRAGELGVATTLDVASGGPAENRDAARAALADDAMGGRCREVADELAALPPVGAAVAALEDAPRVRP